MAAIKDEKEDNKTGKMLALFDIMIHGHPLTKEQIATRFDVNARTANREPLPRCHPSVPRRSRERRRPQKRTALQQRRQDIPHRRSREPLHFQERTLCHLQDPPWRKNLQQERPRVPHEPPSPVRRQRFPDRQDRPFERRPRRICHGTRRQRILPQ